MLRSIKGVPLKIYGNFLDISVGNFSFRVVATSSLLEKTSLLLDRSSKPSSRKSKEELQVEVFTSVVYGKDEPVLIYGFSCEDEKDAFDKLITITGIGPKLAFRIVEFFGKDVMNVLKDSPHRISEVPRIGLKKARALLPAIEDVFGSSSRETHETVELKSKKNSLLTALRNLGFTRREAEAMLEGIDLRRPERDILIEALKKGASE